MRVLGTLALLSRSGVHTPGEYGGGKDDGGGESGASGSTTDSRNPWLSTLNVLRLRGGVMGVSNGYSGSASGLPERGLLTLALTGTWRFSSPFVAAMRLASLLCVGVGGKGVEGGGDGGENHWLLTDFCDRDVRGGDSRHGVVEYEVVGGVVPGVVPGEAPHGGSGKSDGESETTLHLDDGEISEHGDTPSPFPLTYWKSTLRA